MRLATLEVARQFRPAVILGNEVLDLIAARSRNPTAKLLPDDMIGVLEAGSAAIDLLREIVEASRLHPDHYRRAGALIPVDQARFGAPVPRPRSILALGVNYHEHIKEMNATPAATPMGFYKSVSSVVGPGADIILPDAHPDMVDFEGEFAAVIGKTCHNVSEEAALDHVAGYTVVNDVSARNWIGSAQTAQGMINTVIAWEHNILGKQFPTFCPMGPVMVTRDEIKDPHDLKLETRLNGKLMQSTNTSDLVFDIAHTISYYSKYITFIPGDVIVTGSPSGVGFSRKPPVFMKDGDVVEVSVEKIGTLRNTVRAASAR